MFIHIHIIPKSSQTLEITGFLYTMWSMGVLALRITTTYFLPTIFP